jgi:hypothetical protein
MKDLENKLLDNVRVWFKHKAVSVKVKEVNYTDIEITISVAGYEYTFMSKKDELTHLKDVTVIQFIMMRKLALIGIESLLNQDGHVAKAQSFNLKSLNSNNSAVKANAEKLQAQFKHEAKEINNFDFLK